MLARPQIPPELLAVCNRWSEILGNLKEEKEHIEYIQNQLPAVLRNRDLFIQLLKNIVKGSRYPDIRQAQMFEDEILLYLNPKPVFSIRLFIYQPGDYTPIHDHNSWGVIGGALGKIGVAKYIREDDGSLQGYARLRKIKHLILEPGETDLALALNQGIHQTGNPGNHNSMMLSVYGRPIRRVYIQRFDLEQNSVHRMYTPRVKKKLLAAETLKIFDK